MSDSQVPPTESVVASDGPHSNQPTTIDTPPVAATPDEGSNFYNTPLAAGTPSIQADSQKDAATNSMIKAPDSSEPAPMIPGLNLVNDPNDPQSMSNQPPPESTTAAVKQEQEEPETKQELNEPEIQQESSESAMKEEPRTAIQQEPEENLQVNNEPTSAPSDIMEVDQAPEIGNTENAPDQGAEALENEEEGEHPEWEVDSSPYESSSDSSTSTDSDDSDDEDYPMLSPEEQARILMQAEAGSDDEGEGKGKSNGHVRSTNEVAEEVPPIPDVEVTPDMKIVFLGKIQTVVDNALLIEANTSGEYQVLESGSLLCRDDRKLVGVVSETLGRVENPLYTVMYASASEIQERGLYKGMDIFYVEAHSTFVFTQPLKGMKGSDASNFHDEEVAEEEAEFSDDEAEAEYKRRLKQKRQDKKEARDGPARGKKGPPGPSKLSHTGLNYDDGAEDGYTPLARPKNLHEIMGTHEAPVEGNERGSNFRGGRGRGRGSDRGRGRGRGGGGRGGWDRDQDRRPPQSGGSHYGPPATNPQASGYGQPAYPQHQQPAYGMPQPFAGYAPYAQQQQTPQPQFAQGAAPAQFPFQFPFPQAFQQPNPFQPVPAGAHVNPLFLAALQQQQQQQYQQPQSVPSQAQPQNPAMNFDQVKAQLDLLRSLSNGNQGPPPT
ncbi:hypothetical protein NUU61_006326 [Penicillium alfredii]|uniref:H/ACA ribonucleoprotein complex non-core subunit NAF1 n=1 Tax=Penicillium alfredii TaxID=1506179 RepID=A0A9W9K3M7_9EURO|nr:uncharacterized protein NUU61_006326 [Penicillium alfredii]KAJ5091456.1 hypothetical protein NUU61_006326 [Penicillium alfredii]